MGRGEKLRACNWIRNQASSESRAVSGAIVGCSRQAHGAARDCDAVGSESATRTSSLKAARSSHQCRAGAGAAGACACATACGHTGRLKDHLCIAAHWLGSVRSTPPALPALPCTSLLYLTCCLGFGLAAAGTGKPPTSYMDCDLFTTPPMHGASSPRRAVDGSSGTTFDLNDVGPLYTNHSDLQWDDVPLLGVVILCPPGHIQVMKPRTPQGLSCVRSCCNVKHVLDQSAPVEKCPTSGIAGVRTSIFLHMILILAQSHATNANTHNSGFKSAASERNNVICSVTHSRVLMPTLPVQSLQASGHRTSVD